ncbi:hypothetical protein LCGC14_1419840 [marine sediment metagenome]|uniref:Uncharacterized protein n=1 Tax=marine sediment metagenome TaxID=412755 RepID=A0A0F9KCY5_9ZZZZ
MRPKATAENVSGVVVSAGPAAAAGVLAGEIALAVGLDPSLALAIGTFLAVAGAYVIRRFGLPDA